MRLSLQASTVVNRTHERKLHEHEHLVEVPQSTFQPSEISVESAQAQTLSFSQQDSLITLGPSKKRHLA